MAEPAGRWTERDGVRLRYWEWQGGEPPSLLLHGIGNYGRYWDFFGEAVGGRLRLIAPDARGHGESDRPNERYSFDDFAADALAALDSAGIERALLVGHSMGGRHAMHVAARHSARALGLVLVDAGPESDRRGAERTRRLLFGRPDRFADAAAARAYLRQTSPGYSDAVYANRLRWVFRDADGELVWRSAPHALRAIADERPSPAERWASLRAVGCPILIVRGARSIAISVDQARRMLEAHPRARLLELAAGHNVALDRPRELADAVVAFAADIVATAR